MTFALYRNDKLYFLIEQLKISPLCGPNDHVEEILIPAP